MTVTAFRKTSAAILASAATFALLLTASPSFALDSVEEPESPEEGSSQLLSEGNPNWDGLEVPPEVLNPGALSSTPFAARGDDIALKTDAITSAAFDGETVYAATRTAVPAQLHIDTPNKSARHVPLPNGQGSWDMALSGNTLAIGVTAAPNSSHTWLSRYNVSSGKIDKSVRLENAGIVMAVVEDTVNNAPGSKNPWFWVGTYHASGSKLFRVNFGAGKDDQGVAHDFTPGTLWKDYRYVRALTSDPVTRTLTIGLGNQGAAWSAGRGTNHNTNKPKPLVSETDSESESPNKATGKTAMVYSAASASVRDDEHTPDYSFTLLGTEHEARLIVVDQFNNEVAKNYPLLRSNTVDRITVDKDQHRAWFTTRPHGDVYSLDLDDLTKEPEKRATPVAGAETRALTVSSTEVEDASGDDPHTKVVETVRGVTGTGVPWSVEVIDGVAQEPDTERPKIISESEETTDPAVQGVTQLGDNTLVGGHWRYQVHGPSTKKSIPLAGEPKAQTVVDGQLYTALYPSASVYRIDGDLNKPEFVAEIDHGQQRPADIEYSDNLNKLGVATGPAYGRYGGGVSLVDPDGGDPEVYTDPVGEHQVSSMAPYADGFILGTSTYGEAQPAKGTARITYWEPSRDESSEAPEPWSKTVPFKAERVTGVQIINDDAGDFIVASLLVSGNAKARSQAYLVALEPKNGTVLWSQRVGALVTSLEQSRGYVIAQLDGNVTQLGVTRSGFTRAPVYDGNRTISSAYAALEDRADDTQRTAYVSNGANGSWGATKAGVPKVAFRTSGQDRYLTAVEVSKQTYESAKTVILARGDDFADALAAGPLAAAYDAPILLVMHGTQLTKETKDEIVRLGATQAIPVGGTGAIPNSVSRALPEKTKLKNDLRPKGANRYETSVAVAKLLEERLGKEVDVMAATGRDFADAVSAVPAAIKSEKAIVLYDDHPSAKTSAEFMDGKSVEALGGPAANALQRGGVAFDSKIVGKDRFETAAKLGMKYFENTTTAYVAPGLSFPDGLTAGVSAGRAGEDGVPLLLALPKDFTAPTERAIREGLGTHRVYLVGGSGVLLPQLESRVPRLR